MDLIRFVMWVLTHFIGVCELHTVLYSSERDVRRGLKRLSCWLCAYVILQALVNFRQVSIRVTCRVS